jgi:hypothetical protein
MQQSRDVELRYKIEKEEIGRAIKNQPKDQLDELGEAKRRDL